MENISCDAHLELLQVLVGNQNLSFNNMLYKGDPTLWKTLDYIEYIKIVAYAIIIIGGLLGNLSVMLTVALVKSMRNAVNFYVANLAVADAMICMICMLPHALAVCTGDKFVLGEFMCKLNPFTQMTCLTSSVLTLCAISCDRFMAVFYPLEVRTTEKRTSLVITTIWIISVAVSIPWLIVKKHSVVEWQNFVEPKCKEDWPSTYRLDEITNECVWDKPLKKIYYISMSVTLFFLPILIMLIAYIKILFKLWTSKVPGEQHEANINAQSRSRKKVLKMVFIVLVVFIICWMPLQVKVLLSATEYSSSNISLPSWYAEFQWLCYYIAYANSFINPFIYGRYSQNFRDGFCLILRCECQRKRTGLGGRSRLTFTTGFATSSSRSAKAVNVVNKTASQKSNLEARIIYPVTNKFESTNIKETCFNNPKS